MEAKGTYQFVNIKYNLAYPASPNRNSFDKDSFSSRNQSEFHSVLSWTESWSLPDAGCPLGSVGQWISGPGLPRVPGLGSRSRNLPDGGGDWIPDPAREPQPDFVVSYPGCLGRENPGSVTGNARLPVRGRARRHESAQEVLPVQLLPGVRLEQHPG